MVCASTVSSSSRMVGIGRLYEFARFLRAWIPPTYEWTSSSDGTARSLKSAAVLRRLHGPEQASRKAESSARNELDEYHALSGKVVRTFYRFSSQPVGSSAVVPFRISR